MTLLVAIPRRSSSKLVLLAVRVVVSRPLSLGRWLHRTLSVCVRLRCWRVVLSLTPVRLTRLPTPAALSIVVPLVP